MTSSLFSTIQNFYLQRFLVRYLTILVIVEFITTWSSCHVSVFVTTLMPVTTRSQSRCRRDVNLSVSSPRYSLSSSNLSSVSNTILSLSNSPSTRDHVVDGNLYHPVADTSSSIHSISENTINRLCSFHDISISKFQNLEISKNNVLDTGPSCHNSSVSNYSSIMEADCKEEERQRVE
jgi:hypothetical protein